MFSFSYFGVFAEGLSLSSCITPGDVACPRGCDGLADGKLPDHTHAPSVIWGVRAVPHALCPEPLGGFAYASHSRPEAREV
jgi:hypothetical protein